MNFVGRQCLRILQSDVKPQTLSCNNLVRFLSFKSAISLENLYSGSKQNLYTPTFVSVQYSLRTTSTVSDPKAKFSGYIPIDKVQVTYSTSKGPGGQNVNRVNTKVDLRFHVSTATWLSEDIRTKLLEQCKNKINKDGYLIIKSDITRSQHLNLADALEKLRTLIRGTLVTPPEPSPESEEKKRKNLLRAARERLHEKRIRSELKQSRQNPRTDF